VPRLTFAAGILPLVQFKFAAVFGRCGRISSGIPAKAKQEVQIFGFSEQRVIRSPQQMHTRKRVCDFSFIISLAKKIHFQNSQLMIRTLRDVVLSEFD
jgi:hypothetical protein